MRLNTWRKIIRAQLFNTNDVVSKRTVKILIIKYGIYTNKFAEKMWVAFAFHIFSKNNCELDIVLTRTVNILTTNELVKLTMLWTTGPSVIFAAPYLRSVLQNQNTDKPLFWKKDFAHV